MAKGNMLLGKSRGSVGDVTFSQINGQQIAKARNRNPANPRTLKQCFQRGRFAAAVKFYTRGTQALFKFAFENKKQTESDYNAFMRENVKRAPAISKAAFDNFDYPVVAPFVMSKGSLTPMDIIHFADQGANMLRWVVGVPTGEIDLDSIGGLSQQLINNCGAQVGDIITIVMITSAYNGTVPSVEAAGSGKTAWDIKQFIVDPTSAENTFNVTGLQADDNGYLFYNVGSTSIQLASMCVILSRNTPQGLKVSTQELVLSTAAATAYEAEQADAYKEAVAVSWKTAGAVDMQPEAILQGSIAYGE